MGCPNCGVWWNTATGPLFLLPVDFLIPIAPCKLKWQIIADWCALLHSLKHLSIWLTLSELIFLQSHKLLSTVSDSPNYISLLYSIFLYYILDLFCCSIFDFCCQSTDLPIHIHYNEWNKTLTSHSPVFPSASSLHAETSSIQFLHWSACVYVYGW